MDIVDMSTGKTVSTTPEEFMKWIQPNIDEYKKLMERIASYEEE
jgi:hypothetical protein